jgi:hypothetical protein
LPARDGSGVWARGGEGTMADGWGGAPAQFCPGRETLKIELDSGRHRHIGAMVRGGPVCQYTHTHTHTHTSKRNTQHNQQQKTPCVSAHANAVVRAEASACAVHLWWAARERLPRQRAALMMRCARHSPTTAPQYAPVLGGRSTTTATTSWTERPPRPPTRGSPTCNPSTTGVPPTRTHTECMHACVTAQ